MCLLTSGHVTIRRLRICIQVDTVDLPTYLNVCRHTVPLAPLSSHWAVTAVHTLLLIKMNSSSAGCQVSAATCGTVALVLGCLHGWTVLSHTFREVQWHFPGWRTGWWRQRRVTGDACRSPSHFRCWPFSTLWGMGNPWKVKRKLVFNFVCWLDCLCVSLSLVETTSHRAQAGLDPVILSPSLPERGNGNCITMPRLLWGTEDKRRAWCFRLESCWQNLS